jgi:hypothetical protein
VKFTVVILLLLQFASRPQLTPAETLLDPDVLRAIETQPPLPEASVDTAGSDASADLLLLTCQPDRCAAASRAARKINALIAARRLPQPARSVRVVSAVHPDTARRARAAIHVAEIEGRQPQLIRGLWSTAGINDEVVEIFARHGGGSIDVRAFEDVGQLRLDPFGVPTTTIVTNPSISSDRAAFAAAASVYFLATLPNDGAEPLLSHLTVGAHARLAEDGRRAVAMMGPQQRASADVLIMFGQAIEREQRRMRSFERYMPQPIDPMLRSRISDMEKGITSVWTSIGITSSTFVPAAERIRGRGGEDRRVPTRSGSGPVPTVDAPAAIAKLANAPTIVYEIGNLIDGRRSISDIRDLVAAEFGSLPLPAAVEYIERLAKAGAVSIR